jgi:hypothetical protein
MPSIISTWNTAADDRVCPICNALDGYQWTHQIGKDLLSDALFHPVYGIVWSLSQGSNAHDHTFGKNYGSGNTNNCRCTIEHKIIAEDILAKCVYLKETLEEITQETEISDTRQGSSRRTTFEDIGIDPSKYGLE